MNNTKTNSADIEKKITQLEALYFNPKTDAKFKPLYKKGIEELKAKLEKAEPKVTATAQKEKPKAPAKKNVSKVVAKSTKPKVEEKVTRQVKKISSKKVEIDGKQYDIDSKEFCDYLVEQFKERRSKSKSAPKKASKPKSVMKSVATKIESGVTTAIKKSASRQETTLKKYPAVFIGKVEKLEEATKNFLTQLKSVLGKDYDSKEITETTNAIQKLIDDLKSKYDKK
jgi:hypothetical protein